VNLDLLVEVMIRLSYLLADYPEIKELDINPLLVSPTEVVALDARVVIDQTMVGQSFKPYAHLALRPYPEEFVRPVDLEDGSPCVLRPIKPEDEPLWMELLGSCSKETIYFRFRYFFFWQSHEVATRYCYIDYDREIAIVAETKEGNRRRLMAVARMVADPMKDTAEYAILVADPWQDKGLGGLLTDYCIEIARRWGIRRLEAITTSDNHRMVAVLKKRGFTMEMDPDGSLIQVHKDLS
jgi:acetyltransferase